MREELARYPVSLTDAWQSGELPRTWRREYPEIFDDEDLRLALSQPRYHFLEWVGAVEYHRRGFLALVEQYIYEPHPRKLSIVQRLVGPGGLRFLQTTRAQPPDLLIYTEDELQFFVEVKRDQEKLNERQMESFTRIESHFGSEIIVLRLRPVNDWRTIADRHAAQNAPGARPEGGKGRWEAIEESGADS